jgi:hypothetical protein
MQCSSFDKEQLLEDGRVWSKHVVFKEFVNKDAFKMEISV